MTRDEGAKKSHPKRENLSSEHSKRKRPKSRSRSLSDRSTDEERSPSPKRRSKKSKKRRQYPSSPSTSCSSNGDYGESKDRINEGKGSTDSRFRMVSEEDHYNYSLPPDMVQCANDNFNTCIKEADLIKTVLIENPVTENINPVKTLADFVKDVPKDKERQKDLDSTTFLRNSRLKSLSNGSIIKNLDCS